MSEPKVSVIMPAYNSDKYIEKSIKSILGQTYKNIEFIIIDDSSTDNTPSIVNRFKQKDNRVKVIKNNVNLGITKSLNKGIKKSSGKYIARIDADDFSDPKRIAKQVQFLELNPKVFLIGSATKILFGNEEERNYFPTSNEFLLKLRFVIHNPIIHSSIMFRKSNDYYREKFIFSQDYDFYLRLLSQGKRIKMLKDVLAYYKVNPNGISSTHSKEQKYFRKKALYFYFQRILFGKDNYSRL